MPDVNPTVQKPEAEKNGPGPRPGRRRSAGYSLLEILVAIAIIASLTALIAPRLLGQVDRSNSVTAKAQIKQLKSSLEVMQMDIRRFPTEEEGLQLLVERLGAGEAWRGPYISDRVPMDPWGNPFHYAAPTEETNGYPVVYSLGADNQPGGTGADEDIY